MDYTQRNHSHFKITGLETHGKVLYVFVHVFFVDMCTLLHSRHMGKPNLNNAIQRVFGWSYKLDYLDISHCFLLCELGKTNKCIFKFAFLSI